MIERAFGDEVYLEGFGLTVLPDAVDSLEDCARGQKGVSQSSGDERSGEGGSQLGPQAGFATMCFWYTAIMTSSATSGVTPRRW
jgi:hypothetical protein